MKRADQVRLQISYWWAMISVSLTCPGHRAKHALPYLSGQGRAIRPKAPLMKLFLRVRYDMGPSLASSGDQLVVGRNGALSFLVFGRKQHPIAVAVRFLHLVLCIPWCLLR